MVPTSFLDLIQPPSMRSSLILHLRFVHTKPQQPYRLDSCTNTGSMSSGPSLLLMKNYRVDGVQKGQNIDYVMFEWSLSHNI